MYIYIYGAIVCTNRTSEDSYRDWTVSQTCSNRLLRKMKLKSTFVSLWLISWSSLCSGEVDVPFIADTPICSDRSDEIPNFEFETLPLPFEKRESTIFYPDTAISLSELKPFTNYHELPYVGKTSSPESEANSQLHLRKRSVPEENEGSHNEKNNFDSYDSETSPSLLRETRIKDDIKTIHLPSSFTPRLGRKRSDEVENPNFQENYKIEGITGRARIIDLKAGTGFTPRLGRSESQNKIKFYAGSGFTPRLGRSEDFNRIQFNAGSAFTPRLGRSEGSNRIQFNAGSAFTPRLGRSEGSHMIHFNAGSAFTPRLGRSEGSNRIQLNAGSAFTPRLGRSEGSNRILFHAGSAFTPRLGRSEGSNRIHFNAGSAFTPRLGRSEYPDRVFLNAGSAVPPKLGKSGKINMNAGKTFTPRLGRSSSNKIYLDTQHKAISEYEKSMYPNELPLKPVIIFTPRLG